MYLVDTNVISEARRGSAPAVAWLNSVDPSSICLSVVTIGEIQRGILNKQRRDGRAPTRLMDWLQTLQITYADRVLPIDARIALTWGRRSALKQRPDADGFIAATALVHDLTLVTRNTIDFDGTGLALINPWAIV